MRIFALIVGAALMPVAAVTAQTAAPVPAQSAPAAHAPGHFVLPFTRGGTSVERDMRDTLEEVVGYAQRNRNMGLIITAYGAGEGSEASRVNRARRMAEAVRDYLAGDGVPEPRMMMDAQSDATAGAQSRVEIRFAPR